MSEKSKWIEELQDKETRDAFVSSQMSIPIAFQILALREQRGWTQKQLAEKAGMLQPRITAMERPSGSEPNLRTLKRLASAFDVALIVRFAPFSELVEWAEKFSPDIFAVPSFEDDLGFQEREAASTEQAQASVMQENNPFVSGSVQTTTNLPHHATINMSTLGQQHEEERKPTQQLELPLLALFRTDSNQIAAEAVIETAQNPQGEVTRDRGTAGSFRVA